MNPFRTKRVEPATKARRRSRGQVIVIFAGAMLAFMGLMAIVIDVSWYWANTLRVQRAADAAALAGVVWLPNLYSSADVTARSEATKNGYTDGVGGTSITTMKDPTAERHGLGCADGRPRDDQVLTGLQLGLDQRPVQQDGGQRNLHGEQHGQWLPGSLGQLELRRPCRRDDQRARGPARRQAR